MTTRVRINGRQLTLPAGAVLLNGVVVDPKTGEEVPGSVVEINARPVADAFLVDQVVHQQHALPNRPFAGLDWRAA
jgi:hypothetical protein